MLTCHVPRVGGETAKTPRVVVWVVFKLVQLLTRDPDLSHDEFVTRWHGDHAEIAESLPNLRKYTVSVPSRPDRSEYDGVAELYFESEDAMKAAFGSEIGHELTDDFETFVDVDESPTLYVEEDVRLVKTD